MTRTSSGTRCTSNPYSLYSIIPTLIEVTLVLSLLAVKFDVVCGNHRHCTGFLHFFHGDGDELAHSVPQDHERAGLIRAQPAVDSLLNTTVKHFNNEEFEAGA
jgi:ATP-binding cassette subfamily B protein